MAIPIREVTYRIDFAPPGGGNSRNPATYMANSPFQAVHVGDVLNADIWPDTYDRKVGPKAVARVIEVRRSMQVSDDRIFDLVLVESEPL